MSELDLTTRRPLVSVVMPVYNEATTVKVVIDDLLGRTFDEFDYELIIIESNSSDSSREIINGYDEHPKVRIVLQEQPLGKGNAVREGLRFVRGEIVLIQDADLEYDVSDYSKLIHPILREEATVVLGSRAHNGGPIRVMPNEVVRSWITNFGHHLFTGIFNIIYGQKLRDPFTMFKVFRTTCLDGLRLQSNRFDFDWELLGKLCRRGYTPLEVPVSYKSRGFGSGKKVKMIKDPITWVIAAVKFRIEPLE